MMPTLKLIPIQESNRKPSSAVADYVDNIDVAKKIIKKRKYFFQVSEILK